MSEAKVEFEFIPKPKQLTTALEDAEKKAKNAESGIQKFLSSATTQSSGWSSALGGVSKAFGAITALVTAGKVLSFFGDAISEAEELEKKLEELNSNILTAEKKLEELNSIAVKAQKMIKNIDCLFTLDLSKRYGFDQNNMYYIGTASNRIYKKPIDEEIVGLISRIDILDWREIQKINQHFMQ